MLQKFDLRGIHTNIDDSLQRYVQKKLGRLDRYLPRAHRDSAHAIVELKEVPRARDQKKYTCDVVLHLPHESLNVRESTLNMYAAIDIVEEKLKQQIKKYKETHASGKLTRHLSARLRRATGNPPLIDQNSPEL